MAVATRLPGIQFDVVAPPPSLPLVRMDIAVFVGFAAAGPLHTPVAVEDIAHFQEVFGNDLLIANDPIANQQVYALMPSSVRAFFRNGGSRCWVIRVAADEAQCNRFKVPGLSLLQGGSLQQAFAYGRSEGSWSDNVAVGAALRAGPIEVISFSASPPALRLRLSGPDDVIVGDLLRLSFPYDNPDHPEALWLFVDDIEPAQFSPPPGVSAARVVDVAGQQFYWQLASPLSSFDKPVCERVTMDLFVQQDTQAYTLSGLGFAPSHPHYWAALPYDLQLYWADSVSDLWAEATHPRFPLAGYSSPKLSDYPTINPNEPFPTASGFYLPIDPGGDPTKAISGLPGQLNGPELQSADDALIRDGVSDFSSKLFLDGGLKDKPSLDLLQDAYYLRYQMDQPRFLTGIHAALAIDEATIMAVPDAVQRGWFEVERALLASPLASSPLQHPEWWHFLDCRKQQEIPRVPSPRLDQFQPCDLLIVQPPLLQDPKIAPGGYELHWASNQPLSSPFTDFLEEAVDPAFATAEVIYEGSEQEHTVYQRPGNFWYRVRRQVGDISSDYSNTVTQQVQAGTDWQVNFTGQNQRDDPQELLHRYQDHDLLAIHGALLRLCAARGDLFAIMATPQHYREAEAMAHVTELKSGFSGKVDFVPMQPRDFSFGALYHPWLIGREEDDLLNLRTNPPDGAMAGIMAWRSSQRGAWISPANEPLHGVVDLTPPIARASRQELQDSLINLVRQEPSGFICLCELTLSDDPDLSPINVRRLLSFLRKTALLAGSGYVFEPNSDEFRRAVQRGFEVLLDRLLVMGAFAGRTADQAYQVVTDSSLNTRQAMDNGQFFVELKVAPSQPMRFLTVRLLQTADRTFVTEGGA